MDVIKALQAQLQQAQKSSNVRKISEKNCIDLLQALRGQGDVELIATTSGKEWVTPEQLDQEIKDALAANGGRLNINELPAEVGVAIEYCEHRVASIRKADATLRQLQGDLLTSDYVQNVAQEVSESLEEAGFLSVADVATRYSLAAEFVKDSVLPKVEAEGLVVKHAAVYNGVHAARVEARVRGALRACTTPTTISTLLGRHGADTDMVHAAVLKAIAEGVAEGKVSGSTFTPKCFSDNQTAMVDGFFASNQYLMASLAKSSGMELKDWVKARKPEGVALKAVFFAQQLVDSALGSILEALSADSWIDVQPLLPPAISGDDAAELLLHLEQGKKLPGQTVVVGRVALSAGFVGGIAAHFEKEVAAAAEKAMSAPKIGGKKEEDDDDFSSKKKGKKPAKGKKAASEAAAAGSSESGIEDEAIIAVLGEQYPEIPFEAHEELTQRLQPALAARVAQQVEALRSSLQSAQRSLFEQSEKFVQERYEAVVLGLKALEATTLAETPLQNHLLREVVAEPLHRMLALRSQEATGTAAEVTSANRKQVLEKIEKAEGAAKAAALAKLLAAFGGGKSKEAAKEPKEEKKPAKGKRGAAKDEEAAKEAEGADLAEIYRSAADECHIYCRKVDKKREKAALQERRAELREKLKEALASDSKLIFRLGLQLTLIQDGVVGLQLPDEVWAFKLAAGALAEEAAKERATALCGLFESESAVPLQEAIEAWKEQALALK